jgi:hypothetical protein
MRYFSSNVWPIKSVSGITVTKGNSNRFCRGLASNYAAANRGVLLFIDNLSHSGKSARFFANRGGFAYTYGVLNKLDRPHMFSLKILRKNTCFIYATCIQVC